MDIDSITQDLRSRVPRMRLRKLAVYLLGPSHGSRDDRCARFRAALGTLAGLGHRVTAPGLRPAPADPLSLTRQVDEDIDALSRSDLVVILPGSDDLFEREIARLYGVPVVRYSRDGGHGEAACRAA